MGHYLWPSLQQHHRHPVIEILYADAKKLWCADLFFVDGRFCLKPALTLTTVTLRQDLLCIKASQERLGHRGIHAAQAMRAA